MKKRLLILLLFPTLAMADAEKRMVKYECEQVNPKAANFTCKVNDGIKLHMLKKKTDLTNEQQKRAQYEWDRITTNILHAGGHGYKVTANFWPKNAIRECRKVHKRMRYNCTDYLIQKDGSYKEAK